MPQFSYKDVILKLKKVGFTFHRQAGGSHEFWIHEQKGKILIAKHNKSIATGTVLKIAKSAGFKNLTEFQKF